MTPKQARSALDESGKPTTLYFGRFETQGEAESEYFKQSALYRDRQDVAVKTGTVNEDAHKLYAGISPETLALFAEELGNKKVMDKFYQMAVAERSSLKRRLERGNISGFSKDMPRVLSHFVTSNGRLAAARYYTMDLNNAIKRIPREKADVQKEAMRLKEFIDNPSDTGAMASSLAFTWFLGGISPRRQ